MLPIAVLDNIPDLANPDGVEDLIGTLFALGEEMQQRHGIPLRLVVVDTMVAAFGLDDWNSAAEARTAMNVLKRIQQETGAVAIGVHHHGKDKTRGATGSFVFGAAPDFVLTVHRKADENGVARRRWVALTKARSRETGWSCDFELQGEMIGLDESGDPVFCPFVSPQIGAKHTAGSGQRHKEKRHVASLTQAFEDVLNSSGELAGCEGSTFTAVPKNIVRDKFDVLYGGNTDDSNRKAFSRALKALTEKSEIALKLENGDEWLCRPGE